MTENLKIPTAHYSCNTCDVNFEESFEPNYSEQHEADQVRYYPKINKWICEMCSTSKRCLKTDTALTQDEWLKLQSVKDLRDQKEQDGYVPPSSED